MVQRPSLIPQFGCLVKHFNIPFTLLLSVNYYLSRIHHDINKCEKMKKSGMGTRKVKHTFSPAQYLRKSKEE